VGDKPVGVQIPPPTRIYQRKRKAPPGFPRPGAYFCHFSAAQTGSSPHSPLALSGEEQGRHLPGGLLLHLARHMAVGVQCDRNASVPERLAHYLRRHAGGDAESGEGVSAIVNPDPRESRRSNVALELFGERVGGERSSVLATEDELGVLVGGSKCQLLALLRVR
jgi:hypothetical protein